MRKLGLLLLMLLSVTSACAVPTATPSPTATALPGWKEPPLRLALVYTYARDDDPTLYLRAGLYHWLRLAGYYRGDGTLIVEAFPLEINPRTSQNTIDAMVELVLAELRDFDCDLVITLGSLATERIAPLYAVEHVTTPVLYAAVPNSLAEALSLYPSINGLPHRRYPVETMHLAQDLMRTDIKRVLVLGSGAEVLEATQAYRDLQEAFPEIDFTLYTTERYLIWQRIVEEEAPKVDMIMLVSWDRLRDEQWRFVNERATLTWTILNAPVPIFALDEQAVRAGAVGGLVASAWRQGEMLADMVLEISSGAHPSSLSAQRRSSSFLTINLQGLARWELSLPTPVALVALKYTGYPANVAVESGTP